MSATGNSESDDAIASWRRLGLALSPTFLVSITVIINSLGQSCATYLIASSSILPSPPSTSTQTCQHRSSALDPIVRMVTQLDSYVSVPSTFSDEQGRTQEELQTHAATTLTNVSVSVTPENLKTHLALLQSFSNLRKALNGPSEDTARLQVDPSSEWETAVRSAVARCVCLSSWWAGTG